MAMTVDKLMDAMRLLKEMQAQPPRAAPPFSGVQVICDPNALAETTERTFPISRNRSRRIHKKLVKRFGGEFKKQPAIFQINGRLIAHPARYAELRAQFAPLPQS